MNKNSRRKKMAKAARKATRFTSEAESLRISSNSKRNMEQRVFRWKDEATGVTCTKTSHCKINDKAMAFPKPRRDVKLKQQPKGQEATAADNKAADAELASESKKD